MVGTLDFDDQWNVTVYRQNLLFGGGGKNVRPIGMSIPMVRPTTNLFKRKQIFHKTTNFLIKYSFFSTNRFAVNDLLMFYAENHFCQEAAARSFVINSQC